MALGICTSRDILNFLGLLGDPNMIFLIRRCLGLSAQLALLPTCCEKQACLCEADLAFWKLNLISLSRVICLWGMGIKWDLDRRVIWSFADKDDLIWVWLSRAAEPETEEL